MSGAMAGGGKRSRTLGWIALWACLIASLYLPTLGTRFDFNDDGNLVYPSAPMPPSQHLAAYWRSVVGEYHNLGLFRPVLLAHWELEAQLLGPNALRWRLARLLWAAAAAAAMLTLMLELGIRPSAAIVATAVAMWAPDQSEVWRALTLSEGVAMPYAVMGLVCAVRASRSPRPLKWDIGGALFVLAALGCKNTFAAIVPAQFLLRVAPDGRDLRRAWQRHGRRACFLALTLLLPAGHFVVYKTGWHAGQYVTGSVSTGQLDAMIRGMVKEMAFLVLAVTLAIIALIGSGAARARESGPHRPTRLMAAAVDGLAPLWLEYRGVCIAGFLLLAAGIAIYLPVRLHNPGGRYSIPAAWGGDLWFAALLSILVDAPAGMWKRAAFAGVALGVGGIAIFNLAKQDSFAARAACLWRTLEVVERHAPPGTCVGWLYGPDLARGEGIHFAWHARARGHTLRLALIDAASGKQEKDDVRNLAGATCHHPELLVSGLPSIPPRFESTEFTNFTKFTHFTLMSRIEVPYQFGTRRFDCYVWQAPRTAINGDTGTRDIGSIGNR
jgi:hypothetical protein